MALGFEKFMTGGKRENGSSRPGRASRPSSGQQNVHSRTVLGPDTAVSDLSRFAAVVWPAECT